MNRKEIQRCGSCREVLPEALINSRYAVRSRHTGKLLCDRCGTSASPYEGAELYPIRARIPKSREMLRHEVALALDPARFRTAPAFDETAIHEAGHTVVGWQLLVPIDEVRLSDHDSGEARMRVRERPGDPRDEGTVRAAVTLGGDMAVERWCPGSAADDHASEVRGWLDDEDVDLDLAIFTVKDILVRHGEEVAALARALTEHRELTGDQVHELLERAYNKRLRCDGCGQMWPASKMVAHDEDDDKRILCLNCLDVYGDKDPVGSIPRSARTERIYTR